MQKDALLVQQTLAGDEQAFHRLIIEYQADIYALVLAWVKNPDDAKELVQDVFLKSYCNLSSLKQPEKFYFWLRQIAKYHCQNWLERKRENFVPLNENLISETPSIDETLILRETLAKVMQAINELPETEKNILKERYLDESSYSELQAKHGLSYKALNMHLLRAKQKVRARVEKLLAGIGIFSWHDALDKMLLGGVEAVKISAKVKIIAIGVGAVLILSGTGVIVWNYQSTQDTLNVSNQTLQQASQGSQGKLLPVKKAVNKPINKPIEKSKEEINNANVSEKADQSKEAILQKTENIQPKIVSGIEASKTEANKTTISPELETTFREIKRFRGELEAIGIIKKQLSDKLDELYAKSNTLDEAYKNETSEEKQQKLNKEREQIQKEIKDEAFTYNLFVEESETVDKKLGEYLQAHHEMSYAQFGEIYGEIFYSWQKAQDTK